MSAVFPPDYPSVLRELVQRVRALERGGTIIESLDNSIVVDQIDARTWDLEANAAYVYNPHSDWEQVQAPITVISHLGGSNVAQLDFTKIAGSTIMNLGGGTDQDPRVFANGVYDFQIFVQTVTTPSAGAYIEARIDVSTIYGSKSNIFRMVGDGLNPVECTLHTTAILDRSLIPLSESVRVQVRNLDSIDITIPALTMTCLKLFERP